MFTLLAVICEIIPEVLLMQVIQLLGNNNRFKIKIQKYIISPSLVYSDTQLPPFLLQWPFYLDNKYHFILEILFAHISMTPFVVSYAPRS